MFANCYNDDYYYTRLNSVQIMSIEQMSQVAEQL